MTPQPLIDLWLDDVREPEVRAPLQHPILWTKTAAATIKALQESPIRWASLDHDLELAHYDTTDSHARALAAKQTGYAVVLWMAEHDVWPTQGIVVHSWNPPGAENMCGTIERYGPYRALRRPAQFFPGFGSPTRE